MFNTLDEWREFFENLNVEGVKTLSDWFASNTYLPVNPTMPLSGVSIETSASLITINVSDYSKYWLKFDNEEGTDALVTLSKWDLTSPYTIFITSDTVSATSAWEYTESESLYPALVIEVSGIVTYTIRLFGR